MTTQDGKEGGAGKRPPGPAGDLTVQQIRRDPLHFIMSVTAQYGDIVRYSADGWPATLINHPEYIKHVLQDNHRNYSKEGTPDFMMLKPMLGEGILTSEGESWLRQRRMAQPAFHRRRIEAFGLLMTDLTLLMLQDWEARAGSTLEIVKEMTQLTLRIVARALFSYDVSGEASVFGRAVEVLNECMGHFDPTDPTVRQRFRAALATIQQIVHQIIQERRLHPVDRGDFLSMLLVAQDEETGYRMNDRQVRDQVLTLLLAGHETTAKALSWTFYLLGQHPDVEARLTMELAEVLNGCVPTVEDLPRLPYTWMVIEESMRLYPPIWLLSRVTQTDDEIDGFHIPAGSLVTISPYAMHRHPAYWDNPELFDPEHFQPEKAAERPAFAYLPFSGGPRLCLGKHFASVEAHLILATILQRFRLRLLPEHLVRPEALVTLRPHLGLPMTIHPLQ